jgi:hypothetical protein
MLPGYLVSKLKSLGIGLIEIIQELASALTKDRIELLLYAVFLSI